MGRPAADIDPEQILALARRFWKIREIAAFFKVTERTIYNYVTPEQLADAKELGKGDLRDIAWTVAKDPKGIKILHHMLQFHLDEVPVQRAKLADATNDDLFDEVQRRVAASKLIKSGDDWRKSIAQVVHKLPDAKVVAKPSEATGSTPEGGDDDKATETNGSEGTDPS